MRKLHLPSYSSTYPAVVCIRYVRLELSAVSLKNLDASVVADGHKFAVVVTQLHLPHLAAMTRVVSGDAQ